MMLSKQFDYINGSQSPDNSLQMELMEKFNLAFFEAKNQIVQDKIDNTQVFTSTEIKDNFGSADNTPLQLDDNDYTPDDDFLIDYLLSNSSEDNQLCNVNQEYDEFLDFTSDISATDILNDYQIPTSEDKSIFNNYCYDNYDKYGNETFNFIGDYNNFSFIKEPESNENSYKNEINCVQDIGGTLPSIDFIKNNNTDFNTFIRRVPPVDLNIVSQDCLNHNNFGHLIPTSSEEIGSYLDSQDGSTMFNPSDLNQTVLTQNEALLIDDPLLSTSSISFPLSKKEIKPQVLSIIDLNNDSGTDDGYSLKCKWVNCYKPFESQLTLVKHIEKNHVELRKGDEFTCYWENCPRQIKPFNARYKLLIHMRVHSGEKPNKCLFKGCNKAFSRLENLKIHQRSHTGERPYLCQFSSCTKSFSNSSDRAKHQRTHFDTKPYACQVMGCSKKYTDPSSLRKHVKNHTFEEQMQIKKKTNNDHFINTALIKKFFDPSKQKAIKNETKNNYYDHNYSNIHTYSKFEKKYSSSYSIKQDLKIKLQKNIGCNKKYV